MEKVDLESAQYLFEEARDEAQRRDRVFSGLVRERKMNARYANARVKAMETVALVLSELAQAGWVRPVCAHCGFAVFREPASSYACPSCGCVFGGDTDLAGTSKATVTHTA